MRTLYDVQQLLKRYGIFIYTGKRLYDIELMQMEVRDLRESLMLDKQAFLAVKRVLEREYELELLKN